MSEDKRLFILQKKSHGVQQWKTSKGEYPDGAIETGQYTTDSRHARKFVGMDEVTRHKESGEKVIELIQKG